MSSADENRGAGADQIPSADAGKASSADPSYTYGGAGALTAEDQLADDAARLVVRLQVSGATAEDHEAMRRLIAAARATTLTAPPVVEPDAWTYRFRNGGKVLWSYTRKTVEEVKLATRGEHEDCFEFAPLYLAPPVVEAGGDGLRAIPQPGPMPPYSFQDDPSLRASTGQVALSARPAKQPSAGVAAEGLTERANGVEGDRG